MSKNISFSLREAPLTPESYLKAVPDNIKGVFYWTILVVSIFALMANALAVRSILKRKWKFLKKSCLVSLAIADVFTVAVFAVNSLETLSNNLSIWTLGEFTCYFIPMCQVFGTTASSLFLLVIALDRYQNVNLGKSWDPRPLHCIALVSILFLSCAMISYPMFTYFDYKQIRVVIEQTSKIEYAFMCVVTIKERLAIYYLIMNVVIFMPMLAVFIWFYYNIAALIWRHRKPLLSKYDSKPQVEELSTSFSKMSSSTAYSINSNLHPILKKTKNVQVQKKIRTFRIILVLMLSFVICRFPYWCYYALRLVLVMKGDIVWNLHFLFLTFNIANCALDPLLYTFLNETIAFFKIINDFLYKVLCCCCSNDDFEDLEKNSPFENFKAAKLRVSNNTNGNGKVKFVDTNPVGSNPNYQRY